MSINDFDEYCRAFAAEGKLQERAKLLHYLRGWFINVQALDVGRNEEKLGYVGLTDLLNMKVTATDDEIARIAKGTMEAVRHVANNFRERIIRENVMMPTYRAKELDSAGVSWLSKRSGRTIREKLSSTNNLLAVRRRLSLDTGENRLFVAFVRELEECIEQKNTAKNISVTAAEENFQEYTLKLLHGEEVSEIGRWENLPPNNTLLSDRFYRQIWHGWTDLQSVSEMIKSDNDNIGQRLGVVYFWKFITQSARFCRFPQQPIIYEYRDFKLYPLLGKNDEDWYEIEGWYDAGKFSARLGDSSLSISHDGYDYRVILEDVMAVLYRGDEELNRAELTVDTLDELIGQAVEFIFGDSPEKKAKRKKNKDNATIDDLYIDVFAEKPLYLNNDGNAVRFAERIVRQIFTKDNQTYDVALDKADAMYVANDCRAYSVASCMHLKGDNGNKFGNLLRMIEDRFFDGNIKKLAVPLPDIYNEFQLSSIRKALRLFCNSVYTMPRSISVLFNELSLGKLQKLDDGDFTLMVDYVNGKVSITLIEAKFNETVAKMLPETGGFVWERHPTYSKTCFVSDGLSFKEKLTDLLLKCGLDSSNENISHILNVFGIKGLPSEAGNLTFVFDGDSDSSWGMLSVEAADEFEKTKFNVGSFVAEYLSRIKPIIGKNKVYTYLISPCLNIMRANCRVTATGDIPLKGIRYYRGLQEKISAMPNDDRKIIPALWSDQLPALSIKRLYGEFELIDARKSNKISPQFDVEQNIPISRHFVLPKHQTEYRFGLIMGKNDRDIDYEAVVRHRAFPLVEDTECELELTYTYGKDIPYELVFKPVGKNKPFHQAEVLWEDAKEQPFMDLQSPTFFHNEENWQSLRHIKTLKKDDADALDWIENVFGGRIVVDFDSEGTTWHSGRNSLLVLANVNGREAIVSLTDKNNAIRDEEGVPHGTISFLPVPDNHEYFRIHVRGYDSIRWLNSRDGQRYCILYVNAEHPSVAFFEKNFILDSSIYDMHDCDITFLIATSQTTGRESARQIIIDRDGYERFFGVRMSRGYCPYDIEKLTVLYPLHKVYFNGRSVNSPDCPVQFRQCIRAVAEDIPQYFVRAWKGGNADLAGKLFRIMCVMHQDVGHVLYEIADVIIKKRPAMIDDDLGCALGDYDTEDRQKLLIAITSAETITVQDKIAILGKAAWKSDSFMKNAPPHILLEYFDKALSIIDDYKNENSRNVLKCLEYVLAVFRLRDRGDADINKKLSLNNEAMRNLYATTEEMIENKYALPPSRIELEANQSEEFRANNISDFYYALLVYITGGEDEIKLVGINESEE